jgi:hypothetical protein
VITVLDKDAKYIFLRSGSAVLQKLTWILGMSYDLNSNFGQISNSVREIILEIEKCNLKVCYQILDYLQRIL